MKLGENSMALVNLLTDESLLELIERHNINQGSPELNHEINYRDQFNRWKSSILKPKITIPVIGVQGAGKSTFLNALLMDDIVLPVDADETTCIPTEISYDIKDSTTSVVVFIDGHEVSVPCSADGLNPYVNNIENPGNEKNVKLIRIKRNSDLLNNGVVLVDLPGLGSLTQKNTETTLNYINEAEGSIYLLRTIPPITQSESAFIRSTWPMMSKAFFIQNQWNDETQAEVEDGKAHSLNVLKTIAGQCRLDDTRIGIDIVNIYQAFTAKMRDDSEGVSQSGIDIIIQGLKEFATDWKTNIAATIGDNLSTLIGKTSSYINDKIDSVKSDSETLKIQYAQAVKEFNDEYKLKEEQVQKLNSFIRDSEKALKTRIKEEVNIARGNFRNNMRLITKAGVTDGKDLDKAMSDNQKEHTEVVYGEIQPLIYELIYEIRETVSGISEFEFRKNNYAADNPNINHIRKLEEPLKPVGVAGGALLGAYLGAPGGPIGVAIGGFIGGLVGAFLGSKVTNIVIENRAQRAQKVIFPIIDKWKSRLEDDLKKQLNKLATEILEIVNKWLLHNRIDFESKIKSLQENLSLSQEEKDELVVILQKDRGYLLEKLDDIGDIK